MGFPPQVIVLRAVGGHGARKKQPQPWPPLLGSEKSLSGSPIEWVRASLASMVRDPDFQEIIARLSALSNWERQITNLACDGLSNKAIANQLGLSEGTVKIHLNNIYKKLGIRSRKVLAAALRIAVFDYAEGKRWDLNPTLFREFATECMELARSTHSPDRRELFLAMASMWQQMARRWEESG